MAEHLDRAACSQPRMISASPPCGRRSTSSTNQRGTFSGVTVVRRSTTRLSSAMRTTRMLAK
jgi:hypothetical protein